MDTARFQDIVSKRQLTAEQYQFVDFISNRYDKQEPTFVIVNSPGGTGKTHVIVTLVLLFGKSVQVLAPTHKAKSILNKDMQKSQSLDSGCNRAQTFHRFFNAKQEYSQGGKVVFHFPKKKQNQDQQLSDEEDYEEDFSQTECQDDMQRPPATKREFKILIADECSMIHSSILNVFQQKMRQEPGIFIFMGDAKQLPPVGEHDSIIFQQPYINYAFTRNMRAQTEIIAEKVAFVRLHCDKESIYQNFGTAKTLEDAVAAMCNAENPIDCVYLTYTNRKKNMVNNMVRSIIYETKIVQGTGLSRFEEGEVLYFSGFRNHKVENTYKKYGSDGFYKHTVYRDGRAEYVRSDDPMLDFKKGIIMARDCLTALITLDAQHCLNSLEASFYSSDLVRVVSNCSVRLQFSFLPKAVNFLRLQIAKVQDSDERAVASGEKSQQDPEFVWIVPATIEDEQVVSRFFSSWEKKIRAMIKGPADEEHEPEFKKRKKIRNEWYNFWFLKKILLPDLDYTYAMTIHKSQGSQWDTVFVDIANLFWPEDSRKLIYTAVSRAKRDVVFSN